MKRKRGDDYFEILKNSLYTEPSEKNILDNLEKIPDARKNELKNYKINGNYIIYEAAKLKKFEVVAKLIKVGCDINCQNGKFNETILHYYANLEYNELILQKLLQLGAKLESKDTQGYTPLALAIQKDNDKTVNYFLKNGANPNAMTGSDRTPIQIAIDNENRTIVKLLIKHDAKLDNVDVYDPNIKSELKHKLLKHKLRQQGPICPLSKEKPKWTPAEIVASKTFIEQKSISSSSIASSIITTYINACLDDKLAILFQAMALICLQEPKTGITFFSANSLQNYTKKENTLGRYNLRNNCYISTNNKDYLLTACIHEMVHHVCNKIFFNICNPYYSKDSTISLNDQHPQEKFSFAIYNIFENIKNFLQCTTDCEKDFSEVRFNCTSEYGKFLFPLFFYSNLDSRTDEYKAFILFLDMYQQTYYQAEEHRELIARYFEIKFLFPNNQNIKDILSPLDEYISQYFEPTIQNYIEHSKFSEKIDLESKSYSWADSIFLPRGNVVSRFK